MRLDILERICERSPRVVTNGKTSAGKDSQKKRGLHPTLDDATIGMDLMWHESPGLLKAWLKCLNVTETFERDEYPYGGSVT